MPYRRRTETLRFSTPRPTDEKVAERAAAYLPDWEVTRIGPLRVGRTRRGSTVFDVRVGYRKEVLE